MYGLSLFAVGRAAALKTRAAHTAGWLQLALALMALSEVVRRFIAGSEPVSGLMMGMGLVALIANVICLVLISKKRDAGAHMKASYIFSANDVIANAGVILAGFLVAMTGSNYPDLVIGTVVGLIVLNGAPNTPDNQWQWHARKPLSHKAFCVCQCEEVGAGFERRESRTGANWVGFATRA